ncbi:hypothetical protein P2Q00_30185 [Streptomyces coacervatus]|nr:hypothetical protein [Streptomyces coacervatus]MDF2269669.1 hypothetical protein [Streptomyces coacervatus]
MDEWLAAIGTETIKSVCFSPGVIGWDVSGCTDDEREALEGDREAVTALAERLADTHTPAGPTPRDLGTTGSFVPLHQLMSTVPAQKPGQHDKRDIDRKPPDYQG